MSSPVVLIIRDGWGQNPHPEQHASNAVELADTPIADELTARWPHTLIRTCGEDVGLPPGTMGNSEVGHQNIGAGRIVDQMLMRITRAIRAGQLFDNEELRAAFDHVRATGGRLHLLGLVSDGQVHSDIEHLFALIEIARRQALDGDRLIVHAITDGRDTSPHTGRGFLTQVERALADAGVGRVGTVLGRYYAMDRDHRWERTARAYAALTGDRVPGAAPTPRFDSADEAIGAWYDAPTSAGLTGDEFVPPCTIGAPAPITDGDAVIFFNFRGDRPRQITKAFVCDDPAWTAIEGGGFDRGGRLENLFFATMAGYEEGLPVHVVFPRPPRMEGLLGEVVSDAGLTQFRCAETEKFAHVTYFFNDYREDPFPGEDRELIPSPRDVATYDEKPEMSAAGVAGAVLARLDADAPPALIVVNFANPDMVGHTGKLDAVIRAVEVVDGYVGRIVERTLARGGTAIVTADHGNAEQMQNADGTPHTAHTVFDVPLIIAGHGLEGRTLRPDGRLGDIAPTVLACMGLEQPPAMTGTSLLA